MAVFTKRNADLRRHAGEISFPGGRRDEGEDLRATALREADEEIGLSPDKVEMVGALPPVSTVVTNYVIYPFVGLIEPGGDVPSPTRWRSTRSWSCRCPTSSPGFERKRLIRRGVPIKTDTYTVDGNFIWGATARIVGTLLERLRAAALAALRLSRALLDRHGHHVAPLGPRAVVVAHVVDAEQLVQHEPGVRRALADPAVGDRSSLPSSTPLPS